MKKQIIIEQLNNGIVIREESGWSQAVLFNKESVLDEDAMFCDCQKAIGKIFTDDMFRDSIGDLAKETKEKYDTTGKTAVAYRIEMNIVPLSQEEIFFKENRDEVQ